MTLALVYLLTTIKKTQTENAHTYFRKDFFSDFSTHEEAEIDKKDVSS